jgi:HD-like signal output (HDOD) protein
MQALVSERSSASDIAGIIRHDIAMSAKILQLVNSAFFNHATKISTIEQAVVQLGLQMVKNLALSVKVFQDSRVTRITQGFSIEAASNHAFHTAAVARQLVTDHSLAEDAFMAGMLHDIGKLILAEKLPDKFSAVRYLATTEQIPVHVAERQLLGITHAEIGGYLLGIWGLPYPIVKAVTNHHEPSRVPERTESGILEAVFVANCLVNEAEIDEDYLEEIGMQDKVQTWREMTSESEMA